MMLILHNYCEAYYGMCITTPTSLLTIEALFVAIAIEGCYRYDGSCNRTKVLSLDLSAT